MTGAAPDPRLNAYRADLADERLRGRVDAPRYVEGRERQVVAAAAPMRAAPRFDAVLGTELLFGETLRVFDENEGWAWAQAARDAYVGYVPSDALIARVVAPTHRVAALRTFLYPEPDKKAPPLDMLSMNALVTVGEEQGSFLRLADGRFAPSVHFAPIGVYESDFVAVAERFLGASYLWGGRTSIGLDCSGLIQISLQACGRDCPRDTDMQEGTVGAPLPDPGDLTAFRRADLVFWEGHMGVMLDEARLLHASGRQMAVGIEPVSEVIERIASTDGPVTSVRRLELAEAG